MLAAIIRQNRMEKSSISVSKVGEEGFAVCVKGLYKSSSVGTWSTYLLVNAVGLAQLHFFVL